MVQNGQTGYFCNQEVQKALYFQFEPKQTTLKFWPYMELSQISSALRNFISKDRDQVLSGYQCVYPKAPMCASVLIAQFLS